MAEIIKIYSGTPEETVLTVDRKSAVTSSPKTGQHYRELLLPEKPVDIKLGPPSGSVFPVIQTPPGTYFVAGKPRAANGLFGLPCSIDVTRKKADPPELNSLLKTAQEMKWKISPEVMEKAALVFGPALLGLSRN